MDLDKFLSSIDENSTLESLDIIEIVEEPQYSLGELTKFESKYNKNTIEFYKEYKSGFLPTSKDFEKWAHNFEIFLEADGDIDLLLKTDEEDQYTKGGDRQSPPFIV
jgi:hypothetical protein